MIGYEKAKQTAKEIMPKADAYIEYPDAYVFYNSKPSKNEIDDNEVVIIKGSGKVVSYSEYIMNTKYSDQDGQIRLVV